MGPTKNYKRPVRLYIAELGSVKTVNSFVPVDDIYRKTFQNIINSKNKLGILVAVCSIHDSMFTGCLEKNWCF